MAARDTKTAYGLVSIANHWILAVAIIAMITVGLIVDGMDRSPERSQLLALHKATGVFVLALALWRVVWRLAQGFPGSVGHHSQFERVSAHISHWLLLALILIMPLSGLLWSLFNGRAVPVYGFFEIPAFARQEAIADLFETIHRLASKALIGVIGVHVLAAFKHHFIDRDATLKRMLGLRSAEA